MELLSKLVAWIVVLAISITLTIYAANFVKKEMNKLEQTISKTLEKK